MPKKIATFSDEYLKTTISNYLPSLDEDEISELISHIGSHYKKNKNAINQAMVHNKVELEISDLEQLRTLLTPKQNLEPLVDKKKFIELFKNEDGKKILFIAKNIVSLMDENLLENNVLTRSDIEEIVDIQSDVSSNIFSSEYLALNKMAYIETVKSQNNSYSNEFEDDAISYKEEYSDSPEYIKTEEINLILVNDFIAINDPCISEEGDNQNEKSHPDISENLVESNEPSIFQKENVMDQESAIVDFCEIYESPERIHTIDELTTRNDEKVIIKQEMLQSFISYFAQCSKLISEVEGGRFMDQQQIIENFSNDFCKKSIVDPEESEHDGYLVVTKNNSNSAPMIEDPKILAKEMSQNEMMDLLKIVMKNKESSKDWVWDIAKSENAWKINHIALHLDILKKESPKEHFLTKEIIVDLGSKIKDLKNFENILNMIGHHALFGKSECINRITKECYTNRDYTKLITMSKVSHLISGRLGPHKSVDAEDIERIMNHYRPEEVDKILDELISDNKSIQIHKKLNYHLKVIKEFNDNLEAAKIEEHKNSYEESSNPVSTEINISSDNMEKIDLLGNS